MLSLFFEVLLFSLSSLKSGFVLITSFFDPPQPMFIFDLWLSLWTFLSYYLLSKASKQGGLRLIIVVIPFCGVWESWHPHNGSSCQAGGCWWNECDKGRPGPGIGARTGGYLNISASISNRLSGTRTLRGLSELCGNIYILSLRLTSGMWSAHK